MMNGNITKLKERLLQFFEAEPAVGIVYLFGSQATGKARPASDYDF